MKRYPQPRRLLENAPLPTWIKQRYEPERAWTRTNIARSSRDRLRVAIVTESFLPHINGVTNSVLRVLEHLARERHEAVVIAPGRSGDLPESYAGFAVVRVPSLPLPGYRQVRVGLATRLKVVEELQRFQPDVLHLASPFVLGAVAARAAQHMQLPSLAIYQTDIPGFASRYGLTLAADALWAHIVRIHERCSRTLAPSTTSMEDLVSHEVPRVALWPRGVDSELFHPDKRDENLRSALIPDGTVLVGYVGRLAREKNLDALTALAELEGIRLVIVGEGPYESELRRHLPSAKFLGFRTGEDLARTIASLDVLVHTGEHETFCQVIQEAMACGVPVVAPASGGPLDLVESGSTGLLYAPQNRHDLVRCVKTLSDDADLRSTARRHVWLSKRAPGIRWVRY